MREVRRLVSRGIPDGEIARRTGVPGNTVGRWRRGATAAFGAAPPIRAWRPPDEFSYAYLLGMYLGDGCLSESRRRVVLRVVLDASYQGIVEECAVAMQLTIMACAPRVYRLRRKEAFVVQAAGRRWLDAFPQHGPGRKHERPIALAPWQEEIVDAHPEQFLRGLIHSDGCRTVNRFKTQLPSGRVGEYEYPRYFFTNISADIRGIFCATCDALGIRWTQSNARNISVSHRASVARLDEFVGPKA